MEVHWFLPSDSRDRKIRFGWMLIPLFYRHSAGNPLNESMVPYENTLIVSANCRIYCNFCNVKILVDPGTN